MLQPFWPCHRQRRRKKGFGAPTLDHEGGEAAVADVLCQPLEQGL
jgi:hypothetical protein